MFLAEMGDLIAVASDGGVRSGKISDEQPFGRVTDRTRIVDNQRFWMDASNSYMPGICRHSTSSIVAPSAMPKCG